MLCDDKLYHSKVSMIRLSVTKGFTVDDLALPGADLEVTLTYKDDDSVKVSKSYLAGGITVDGDGFLLRLEKEDITRPGFYFVKITFKNTHGDDVGVKPCPEYLKFDSQ